MSVRKVTRALASHAAAVVRRLAPLGLGGALGAIQVRPLGVFQHPIAAPAVDAVLTEKPTDSKVVLCNFSICGLSSMKCESCIEQRYAERDQVVCGVGVLAERHRMRILLCHCPRL